MGIRRRMMIYLVAFVVCVLAMLWLCQIVMLDDFYRHYKTRQLSGAADAMVGNMGNAELDVLAEQLAAQNELCIMLLDGECRPLISSEGQRFCLIHRMKVRDLSFWSRKAPADGAARLELFSINPNPNEEYDERRFTGRVPPRAREEGQVLFYARRVTLPDGQPGFLLLNSLITPVDATVSTLRAQMAYITVIVLSGAVLLALVLSRRLSQPIIDTNNAARALSRSRYDRPQNSCSYREIAELNDTLSAAAAELNQVEHLQHELIANVSHDLRTPLTMISGYAEVMRDIPAEVTAENMQIIIDESRRLSTLVTELLDFSRLQAGLTALTLQPVDVTEAIHSIVARCAALMEKDGYVIDFTPDTHVTARADAARLSQVVYNLLNNALTYTGEDKRVQIRQIDAGDRVRIEVQDSGRGIPEEELPLIWNRYYRAKESHRRAVQGSGLGLSIVRTILESHGAPYGVTSRDGEGTCFWFELEKAQ